MMKLFVAEFIKKRGLYNFLKAAAIMIEWAALPGKGLLDKMQTREATR